MSLLDCPCLFRRSSLAEEVSYYCASLSHRPPSKITFSQGWESQLRISVDTVSAMLIISVALKHFADAGIVGIPLYLMAGGDNEGVSGCAFLPLDRRDLETGSQLL